ncbi:MAG: hypothetical protein H6Q89_1562 [Myxococcaceae bacterium]|nr:hypothetical protein [Myxococcaceae bacterium]
MKFALALALLGSGLAWAQPFIRTQVPGREDKGQLCVTWNKRELVYVVDSAGSARTPGESEFFAVDASFASWQAVSDTCSDFLFRRGERLANVQIGRGTESSNAIVFREESCRTAAPQADPCQADGSCANRYACWDHSDFTIALTTTTFSTKTGAIYDADIELNSAPHVDSTRFLFTTISSPPCTPGAEAVTCVATDIQNTLTHEIGHAVGFDHVENPGTTMEATAPPGETQKRIIDVGLSEGFCKTYPRGLPPVPCDELAQLRRKIIAKTAGTPGLSALGCSAAPVGSGRWLLGLLVLGLRRRR